MPLTIDSPGEMSGPGKGIIKPGRPAGRALSLRGSCNAGGHRGGGRCAIRAAAGALP
jgi:hypothetical protein